MATDRVESQKPVLLGSGEQMSEMKAQAAPRESSGAFLLASADGSLFGLKMNHSSLLLFPYGILSMSPCPASKSTRLCSQAHPGSRMTFGDS